ncbi:hypothetical protein Pcinc_034753 [Petrolisthes cinctipes]|uniref:Uncharacterized protein n=1 Tax=Petrolisthes cinctipes TaxID=88211 RepID=A0AAE1BY44_PETCI|nr:hypothetical protein Pcinc_034753 [Petrolisthes cinctipes]
MNFLRSAVVVAMVMMVVTVEAGRYGYGGKGGYGTQVQVCPTHVKLVTTTETETKVVVMVNSIMDTEASDALSSSTPLLQPSYQLQSPSPSQLTPQIQFNHSLQIKS